MDDDFKTKDYEQEALDYLKKPGVIQCPLLCTIANGPLFRLWDYLKLIELTDFED